MIYFSGLVTANSTTTATAPNAAANLDMDSAAAATATMNNLASRWVLLNSYLAHPWLHFSCSVAGRWNFSRFAQLCDRMVVSMRGRYLAKRCEYMTITWTKGLGLTPFFVQQM